MAPIIYTFSATCRIFLMILLSKYFSRYSYSHVRSLKQLAYHSYGNPLEVIKLETVDAVSAKTGQSMIRIKVAPINPADLNTIQGVYPIKPSLPAVPGGECVAEVIDSESFRKGDHVIILKLGWGTWREAGVIEDKYLYKVPANMPPEAAAQLSVNPCTAYRMLNDFVNLDKGDVIIQNGANSAVGQFVIQLCRERGIRTINIVRNRPDISQLKSFLQGLGADFVLTEEEHAKGLAKLNLNVAKPKLALNCVGGRSATDLSRSLQHGGFLVTYGGMSKQPVVMPTAHFIFNDIKAYGFWMSRWKETHGRNPELTKMLDELCKLSLGGKLMYPKSKLYGMDDWRNAINQSMTGFSSEKSMFTMG